MSSSSVPDLNTLTRQVNILINSDLKAILKNEHLPVSGVKIALQNRVLQLVNNMARNGDKVGLVRVAYQLANHGQLPSASTNSSTSHNMPSVQPPPVYNSFQANARAMANGHSQSSPQSMYSSGLRFKSNPFFEIKDALSITLKVEALPGSRDSRELRVALNNDQVTKLKDSNSGFRVCVYATSDDSTHRGAPESDVSFPAQVELRVNGEDVKSNFKGVKNKPGSTRPVDITPFLKKQPNYTNTVKYSYALTSKRFQVVVFLVRKRTVDDLLEVISNRGVITKEAAIREIIAKASDPDIVATSSKMSLKDPVSMSRITVPCRTTSCTHSACFDGRIFLELQEQAPVWTCPICDKKSKFEALAIDQYVQDILRRSPAHADQVIIEPNGQWSLVQTDFSNTNGHHDDADDSDDDIVEIVDPRVKGIKSEAPVTPLSFVTPSINSRETSVATPAASLPRAGQKRKSEVVDLISSDEDEPVRPAKRQAITTTIINGSSPSVVIDHTRNGYPTAPPLHSQFRPPPTNPVSFQMTRPSSANHSHPQSLDHIAMAASSSRGFTLPSPPPRSGLAQPPSLGNNTYSSNNTAYPQTTYNQPVSRNNSLSSSRPSFGTPSFPSQPRYMPLPPPPQARQGSRPPTPSNPTFAMQSPGMAASYSSNAQSPQSTFSDDHVAENMLPFLGQGAYRDQSRGY